jgi:hypothetical protein
VEEGVPMRYFFISLFMLFSLNVLLHAEEVIKQPSDVQKLISKIKKAPTSERRVLINQLKLKLKEMNKNTRTKIMLDLRRSFTKQSTSIQGVQTKQMGKNNSAGNIQMPRQGGIQNLPNRSAPHTPMPHRQYQGGPR